MIKIRFGCSLLVITIAISFLGCDEDANTSSYDIFVYGVQNQKGTFWKNGEEHPEPLLANFLLGSFVDGKDFYVAGIGEGGAPVKAIAKYWKNGEEVVLSDGIRDEWAYDVAVVGTDVYVVGYDNGNDGSTLRAKYWKNGNEVILGSNTDVNFSAATNVLVSGSDVYIQAWENVNRNDSIVARLWKNGKKIHLQHDSVYYYVNSMAVGGNDVHLLGYEMNKQGFRKYWYWKNGIRSIPPQFGDLIAFHNNDTYIVGMNGNKTGFWKNNTFQELTEQKVYIVSIDFFENDVIVAGNMVGNNGETIGGIVWKNGVPQAPFLGTDPTIRLEGAAVAKR